MILSEPDLVRWGRRIGEEVGTPVVLALRGPLGAGKSVLARAVARGAGVASWIPSPTFNLLFRYPASRGREVVHLDLYRLVDPAELWEVGWEEVGGPGDIVLVEWAGKAGPLLQRDRWDVELHLLPGRPDLREVEVTRAGEPLPLPLPGASVPAARDGLR